MSDIEGQPSRKRKLVDLEHDLEQAHLHQAERCSHQNEAESYNGTLFRLENQICIQPSNKPGVSQISSMPGSILDMMLASKPSPVVCAESMIRQHFIRRLKSINGEPVSFSNDHDTTTPPLNFEFIQTYVLREDVYRAHPDTLTGCTKCRPDMGQNIGCEYTQWCDCLEYASPNEKKLSEAQLEQLQIDQDTTGLPKRFPYQKDGRLVSKYLQDRFPIYECNSACKCGPKCRTRLVQKGRTVKLEIFKTQDRGWGMVSSYCDRR